MSVFDDIKEGIEIKMMKKLRCRQLILILLDMLYVIFSGYLALFLRFNGPIPIEFLNRLLVMLVPMIIVGFLIFWFFRLYHSLWQFASVTELKNIVLATIFDSLANLTLLELTGNSLPRSSYFIYFLVLTMLIGGSRFIYRFVRLKRSKSGFNISNKEQKNLQKVMIIGAGAAGEKVYREINNAKQVYKQVMCFIDDDTTKHGRSVHGVTIYGGKDKINEAVKKYGITFKYDGVIRIFKNNLEIDLLNDDEVCNYLRYRFGYVIKDYSIKGYAFGDALNNNDNYEMIQAGPELFQFIYNFVDDDLIDDFIENSKLYQFDYLLPFNQIWFENYEELNDQERQYHLVVKVLQRLYAYKYENMIFDDDNPVIGIKNNQTIKENSLISKIEVN